MQQKLVRWQVDLGLLFRRIDNAVCAFLECALEEWNYLGWLGDEAVCEGLVEGDEVGDVDVAVVLF